MNLENLPVHRIQVISDISNRNFYFVPMCGTWLARESSSICLKTSERVYLHLFKINTTVPNPDTHLDGLYETQWSVVSLLAHNVTFFLNKKGGDSSLA
jgi:hypothetical protein